MYSLSWCKQANQGELQVHVIDWIEKLQAGSMDIIGEIIYDFVTSV